MYAICMNLWGMHSIAPAFSCSLQNWIYVVVSVYLWNLLFKVYVCLHPIFPIFFLHLLCPSSTRWRGIWGIPQAICYSFLACFACLAPCDFTWYRGSLLIFPEDFLARVQWILRPWSIYTRIIWYYYTQYDLFDIIQLSINMRLLSIYFHNYTREFFLDWFLLAGFGRNQSLGCHPSQILLSLALLATSWPWLEWQIMPLKSDESQKESFVQVATFCGKRCQPCLHRSTSLTSKALLKRSATELRPVRCSCWALAVRIYHFTWVSKCASSTL